MIISFIVEHDGAITNIKLLRGVTPSLNEETLPVVSCIPEWISGKQNGSIIRVKCNVPVAFRLQAIQEDDSNKETNTHLDIKQDDGELIIRESENQ